MGAAVGSLQDPTALPLSRQLLVVVLLLLRATVIWFTVLHKWLFIAVTLEKLSFADGIVLARAWRPTVSRQPELLCPFPFPSSELDCIELPSLTVLLLDSTGTMTKPSGSRGMQDGSSPLIASWIDSTSTVVNTTRLPDWSVQLSCSMRSTCCDELLATYIHASIQIYLMVYR